MNVKAEKMTKKYILTGGPGSGKSSIILALEQLGEYTIREAAEDYIKLRQAQEIKEPWLEPNFQEGILELQVQREGRIPKEVKRVFIDRGIPDGLAYTEQGTEINRKIQRECKRYDKVFLIENLGGIEQTEVRRENQEQALEIERKLEEIYTNLGYKPIRIGSGTINERTQNILKIIERRLGKK